MSLWDIPGVDTHRGGVLTDGDYKILLPCGHLVTRDDGQLPSFEQAALDVHMSEEVKKPIPDRKLAVVQPENGEVRIKPGEVLIARTVERFALPGDVQGQVSPKAKLTTLGLFFPTTHVDPGFGHYLWLPIANTGPNEVRLTIGMPVGKVELQRLHSPVDTEWRGSPGFSEVDWEMVVPGPSLEERLQGQIGTLAGQLRRRVLFLQWTLLLLCVAALTWAIAEPVSDLATDIDVGPGFLEDLVAPLLVTLLGALIVFAVGAARSGAREAWRKIRLLPPQDPPDT